MQLLKTIVEKKRYSFHEGFDDWREAVRAACQPLVTEGVAEPVYVNEIVRKVEELGPYIVIAPDICIPHAQEGLGVNDTAVAFMKTERPVSFAEDGEHDARLFFVLASTDNERHMENLMQLSEELSDEEFVKKLLAVKNAADLEVLA